MVKRNSLFLGLLALMSFLTLAELRPLSRDDLGIVIGPHAYPETDENVPTLSDDDLGTVIGPHEYPETENVPTLSDDDLGIVLGPHKFPEDETVCSDSMSVTRKSFPEDFIFGTATSAYQVEGAKNGAGRGLTTWDEFTHKFADKVEDRSDGDIAVDSYNRYKEDIQLMKDLNTNGYRFSISWTRILPYGRADKGINEAGIEFYNNLIDELIENGIQPAVTLFHWESPLALEIEYNGFLDKRIVEDFRDFSKICFERFGDRVKNWGTFNEPWVYSVAGYCKGKKAPGRCSRWVNETCIYGNSGLEPYTVSHNQLLAHVAAAEEFRKCSKCQENGGKIGIVFNSPWFEPRDPNSAADRGAANRALDFQLGWFLYPLTYGVYPSIMKETVGNRLPSFNREESEKLTKSMDFVGLNYYGAFFTEYKNDVNLSLVSYGTDLRTEFMSNQTISPHLKATSMGIVIYPQGLKRLLKHIKDNYKNPEIYIMENGMDEYDDGRKQLHDALDDNGRKEFIRSHILILGKSICQDKVRVKGYFFWSLMDNFEWNLGYNTRFGLYYVDYKKNLTRHMRSSGGWLKEFLSNPDEYVAQCFFEGHRAKGYPPKLFSLEFENPEKYIRYVDDII